MIYKVLFDLYNYEKKQVSGNNLLFSIIIKICILLPIIFLLLITLFALMNTLSPYFTKDGKEIYWSFSDLIPLTCLIMMPVILHFFNNVFNKEYYVTLNFLILFTIFELYSKRFSLIALLKNSVYLAINLFLSTITLDIIWNKFEIKNTSKIEPLIITSLIVHIAIYITVNLLHSHKNTFEVNCDKFMLWLLALIGTLIYLFTKIETLIFTTDIIYFIFVLIISLDRTINSFKLTKGSFLIEINEFKAA